MVHDNAIAPTNNTTFVTQKKENVDSKNCQISVKINKINKASRCNHSNMY